MSSSVIYLSQVANDENASTNSISNADKALNISSYHDVNGRKGYPENTGDEPLFKPEKVPSICSQISPCSHGAKLVRDWTVDNVCHFVESIESCKQYVEVGIFLFLVLI